MAGLHLAAVDLARIGALYLTAGDYRGRRVLPAAWVATTPPAAPSEVGVCCFADYAWIDRSADGVRVGPRTGFGHTGDFGQHLSIQPEAGVAAVRQQTTYTPGCDTWPGFAGAVHTRLRTV